MRQTGAAMTRRSKSDLPSRPTRPIQRIPNAQPANAAPSAEGAPSQGRTDRPKAMFHPDSYGYRPYRSAKQAIATTRKRCWQHDWVVEFDIKAAFGSCFILPPGS